MYIPKYPPKNFSPFYYASPEIIEVKIINSKLPGILQFGICDKVFPLLNDWYTLPRVVFKPTEEEWRLLSVHASTSKPQRLDVKKG